MKKSILVLALVLLAALPAAAQTFDWSAAGSTGIVPQNVAFNTSVTGPTLKFRSTATGTQVARYNITNTVGSGTTKTPAWTNLRAAFTDDSALGSVTVTLYKVDKCSATQTEVCTISSADDPAAQCQTCSFANTTFDFANNSYYVEVTLARSSTAANEQIHSVAVD